MDYKTIKCPVCFSKGAIIGFDKEPYLECNSCAAEPIDVSKLLSELVIGSIRKIVEDKAYAELTCHVTGEIYLMDLFTASAIVLLYDGLNDENKVRYALGTLTRMQKFAMRILKDQT